MELSGKHLKIVRILKQKITKQKPLEALIKELNPLLRSWANYFRSFSGSKYQLNKLHFYIWRKIHKWARARHRGWGFHKIAKQYLPNFKVKRMKARVSRWDWGVNKDQLLFNIAKVMKWSPVRLKITQKNNPYTEEGRAYHESRKKSTADTKYKVMILKKYQYICTECNESLLNGEPYEFHHLKPVKEGGTWKPENIMPLHKICHQNITAQSRKITK